jgi:hypothetical protein
LKRLKETYAKKDKKRGEKREREKLGNRVVSVSEKRR